MSEHEVTAEKLFLKWRRTINMDRQALRSLTDKFYYHVQELAKARARIAELEALPPNPVFPEYPDREGEEFDKLKIDLYQNWSAEIAKDPAALIELVDTMVDTHYDYCRKKQALDAVPFEAIAMMVEPFHAAIASAENGSEGWQKIDAWVVAERARRKAEGAK